MRRPRTFLLLVKNPRSGAKGYVKRNGTDDGFATAYFLFEKT